MAVGAVATKPSAAAPATMIAEPIGHNASGRRRTIGGTSKVPRMIALATAE